LHMAFARDGKVWVESPHTPNTRDSHDAFQIGIGGGMFAGGRRL